MRDTYFFQQVHWLIQCVANNINMENIFSNDRVMFLYKQENDPEEAVWKIFWQCIQFRYVCWVTLWLPLQATESYNSDFNFKFSDAWWRRWDRWWIAETSHLAGRVFDLLHQEKTLRLILNLKLDTVLSSP